jgi:hypothetical protein
MRKNIYNQLSSFLDYIKSNDGVSLFTKNNKFVKFKNLQEGENIKIIDLDDTITIHSETPSSRSNNAYRKILISGIINDTYGRTFLKISTTSEEFSLRITGYSYQGHSSHCFVSNSNPISYIGLKYIENEFQIVGDANNCEISFNKAPQLFSYVVEIISKSSIYISPSRYGITYIS